MTSLAAVALLAVVTGFGLTHCVRRGRTEQESLAQAVPVVVPLAVTWGAEEDEALPHTEVAQAAPEMDQRERKQRKRQVRALIASVAGRHVG